MSDDTGPEEPVLLNITAEGVAVVTLNRPKVHNAFNPEVIERLYDLWDDIEDQPNIRVVLIDGAGPSFSAGADLNWMKRAGSLTPSENREDARGLADMLLKLRGLPQPTVALVHGAAIAGGMGLVSACDIAIASADAVFGLSEVRLGIIPAVISPYVIEAIGPRAARRYFLTGERFGAEEAKRLGLVHVLVPDRSGLSSEAERITAALLAGAPGAITAAKDLLATVTGAPIDATLAAETARRIADQRGTDEAKEGLSSFLEKRKPNWAPVA
jgi:methylglutaconyl-CoA hydratase